MANEILWGRTPLGGSVTPINPANMTDGAFNDLVASFATINGDVFYETIDNTVELDFTNIVRVLIEVRFRGTALLTNDTVDLQYRPANGGAYTSLELFDSVNAIPTVLTTKQYDITGAITTVTQINDMDIRIIMTRAGGSDATIEVDEVRIVLEKRTIDVFDSPSITENAQVIIGEYGVSVFDTVSILENANVQNPILPADVFDAVSIIEDVTVSNPLIYQSVFDEIFITESAQASLDALFMFVLEPFSTLVTEHIDVENNLLEVGVVEESIYVDGSIAYANLDVLNTDQNDTLSILEFASAYLNELFASASDDVLIAEVVSGEVSISLSVGDDVFVNENSSQYPTELFFEVDDVPAGEGGIQEVVDVTREEAVEVDDNIAVIEDALLSLDVLYFSVEVEVVAAADVINIGASTLYVDVYDDITTTDEAVGFLPWLSVVVENEDEINISDLADVNDATVRIGPSSDFIHPLEVVFLYPTSLHPFGPDQPTGLVGQHTVVEAVFIDMPLFAPLVFDDILFITETAQASISMGFSVVDTIAATESVSVVRDPQLAVFDFVAVNEQTSPETASLDNLFMATAESVAVDDELIILRRDPLLISVFDAVSVAEFINPQDITIELGIVFDTVGPVTELQVIIQIVTAALNINVHDNVTWSGYSATLGLDPMNISILDTVSVAEHFGGLDEEIDLAVFDTVTVVEFRNVTPPFNFTDVNLSVYDEVVVVEDQTTRIPVILVSVFEPIVTTEVLVADTGNNNLSRFDAVNVQEQVTIDREILINVYDSIVVVERLVARDSLYQDTPILFQFPTRVRIFYSDQINTTGVLIP